jgi:hypothetical protein
MGIPLATWNFTMSDTGHPSRLSSQVSCDHLMTILHESSVPSHWKIARIAGWVEALKENAPQTFRSLLPVERITALQTT